MKLVGYDSDSIAGDLVNNNGKYKIPDHALRDYGIRVPAKVTANKTGRCWYCKTPLDSTNYTRDHVHPKSLGGTKTKACCLPCNREKANMTLIQYIKFLEAKPKGCVTEFKILNAKKLLKNNHGSM